MCQGAICIIRTFAIGIDDRPNDPDGQASGGKLTGRTLERSARTSQLSMD